MKSTGIVRKVDELGRVVIPIELRRTLNINTKDSMEIHVDDESIIFRKYKPTMTCQMTGKTSEDNLVFSDGKFVLSPEGAKELVNEIETMLKETDE